MCDAEAFMKAALEDNGWTRTSRVRVLADGADGLSNVVNTAAEETTHRVLDWFHISMRLRPIEQMSPGVATIVGDADPALTELLSEKIDRVRFQMWNGHWQAALDRLGAIYRTTKKFLSSSCTTDAERIHRFRSTCWICATICATIRSRYGTTLRTGGMASGYPALWPNLQ
jgi:hypothetical protein